MKRFLVFLGMVAVPMGIAAFFYSVSSHTGVNATNQTVAEVKEVSGEDQDSAERPVFTTSSSAIELALAKKAKREKKDQEIKETRHAYNFDMFSNCEDVLNIGERAKNNPSLRDALKHAKKMGVVVMFGIGFATGESWVVININSDDQTIIRFLLGSCGGCA